MTKKAAGKRMLYHFFPCSLSCAWVAGWHLPVTCSLYKPFPDTSRPSWQGDTADLRSQLRCPSYITPAVKYRRFYLPKFSSAALSSVDAASLRRLLPPCRRKIILRKIRRHFTAGVIVPRKKVCYMKRDCGM